MSKINRSKSGTFLMELLFNLFLFCLLCSCGLLFFSKSHNMTKDTTALHQAVSLATSVASIYESGDGSLLTIAKLYPCEQEEYKITFYLNESFHTCEKENADYTLTAVLSDETGRNSRLIITINKNGGPSIYELTTRYHTQTTVGQIKEAQHDD